MHQTAAVYLKSRLLCTQCPLRPHLLGLGRPPLPLRSIFFAFSLGLTVALPPGNRISRPDGQQFSINLSAIITASPVCHTYMHTK
ncbi:unnamed protein product [Protopolystoma xenopodis]|uniref:Uncharacterized protein n=1 Tax=Protopolystoma xenopodis TaxID=117903 RepID=A0A448WTY1_9PLAT|nr:unnamed protein product [Protopolystoma xenopodis]